MKVQPQAFEFSYKVYLAVSLPRAWTTLLKRVAAQHYDALCQESGRCGVINGLHNTACDSEFPSSFRVTWRDLDLITKVMEQAHYIPDSADLAKAINRWLRETKAKIEARAEMLDDLPCGHAVAESRGSTHELC